MFSDYLWKKWYKNKRVDFFKFNAYFLYEFVFFPRSILDSIRLFKPSYKIHEYIKIVSKVDHSM